KGRSNGTGTFSWLKRCLSRLTFSTATAGLAVARSFVRGMPDVTPLAEVTREPGTGGPSIAGRDVEGPRVPEQNGPVPAARCQQSAVGAELDRLQRAGGAFQCQYLGLGGRVPHLHRAVVFRRDQPPAIGAEGDVADVSSMALQPQDRLALRARAVWDGVPQR